MATIKMPPKSKGEEPSSEASQKRPNLERYRLQVDRQTKASYELFETAEKVGKVIKKAYPIVQVIIYDAQESSNKVIS